MIGSKIKEILKDFELKGSRDDSLMESFSETSFLRISDKNSISRGSIYFCASAAFLKPLEENNERDLLVIFAKKFFEEKKEEISQTLSQLSFFGTVENVPLAMGALSKPFYDEVVALQNDEVDGRQLDSCDIHPTAVISQGVFLGQNVKIGKDVRIYPGCVICSDSEVGEGTVLYPNVSVMAKTKIGKGCRLHSGTVIGSDGFGYNFADGVHHKVWHMGGVVIEDNVEIGSNCCVDQGTFSPTIVGAGSKIDNQVQVAHNVRMGQGVIVCGQGGLAGSSSVGNFTVFGGGARLAPDIHVGSGCQVGGNAGVTANLEDGATVAGFPARPIKEWLKGIAYLRKMSLKK